MTYDFYPIAAIALVALLAVVTFTIYRRGRALRLREQSPKVARPAPVETPRTADPAPIAGKNLVFVSYRRSDSIDVTGRIYDKLVAELGATAVFKDIDSI